MNENTIFITGGAGFIGSALIRHLVTKTDYVIINLDKLTYAGNLESLESISTSSRYHFVEGDICDKGLTESILKRFKPSKILHLAAESHVDRSIDGPSEFIKTNILGTFNLLECSLEYWNNEGKPEHFRFQHISTDEVFGSLGAEGKFTEETRYDPSSPYSASKASSDHLVRAWHRTYGLPVLVTNCSNNYGPYHFPEKLIPLVINNALAGMKLPVYGKGNQIRDWLYVDDHVKALQVVLEKGTPGETYNVGGDSERQNIEVVKLICSYLDKIVPSNRPYEGLIEFVQDRPGHDLRYAIDCSKLKTELGWKQEESFDSGLLKTVKWFVENKEWTKAVLENKYSGQRLGLKK